MTIIHVPSMSTGKDSVATLCYAMETVPLESIGPAFADTGNEHELVYTHLEYLERETGMKVTIGDRVLRIVRVKL